MSQIKLVGLETLRWTLISASMLGFAAASIGFSAFCGHVGDWALPATWGQEIPMALPTSVAVLILGVATTIGFRAVERLIITRCQNVLNPATH